MLSNLIWSLLGLKALTSTSLITNPSTGLLDLFGTGGTSNGAATLYALPAALNGVAGDGWFVAQWGQVSPITPNNYVRNSTASYDPFYGNALYSWSSPGTPSSFSIYKNLPAYGSGDVYQINLANETLGSGSNQESDSFMSSPAIAPALGNLSHPITLSLNASLIASYVSFVNSQAAQEFATDPYIFNTIDFGFTVNFDGADGLPAYSGFVQIVPWVSNSVTNSSYETIPISSNLSDPSQFIASLLLGSNSGLPLLPSDKNAAPVNLSYDVNEYVYAALTEAFANFSGAERAALLNLSNWSIGGMYLGVATNGQDFENLTTDTFTSAVNLQATLQLSNIQLTSQTSQTYNSGSPFTATETADTNPKISFNDLTVSASGLADGGAYTGSVAGIKYEYIYNGADSIRLTAPQGSNWYFGGGTGLTQLVAISGNNVFLASTGGTVMTSGSGDDIFDVPDANVADVSVWDMIVNFHAGDQVDLAGLVGSGWTYSWAGIQGSSGSTGLTLLAQSRKYPGLQERITLVGVTSLNPAGGKISLVANGMSGVLKIMYAQTAANVPATRQAAAVSSPQMSFISPSTAVTAAAQTVAVGAGAQALPQVQTGWASVASAPLSAVTAGVGNTAELAAGGLAVALLQAAPTNFATGWVATVGKQALL